MSEVRLIDANALIEKFKEECVGECDVCSELCFATSGRYCALIENAPTVEKTDVIYLCKYHKEPHCCKHTHRIEDSLNFEEVDTGKWMEKERPQGEWIKAKGERVTDKAYKICFMCSECKTHYEYPFNFCPYCGAEMSKE